MKANMGKLVLGIVLMLAGMGIALLVWNLLVGMEIVYLSNKRVGISQLIPVLCTVPGVIVYIIWFFGRKGYVERTQLIDDKAFKFAGMLVAAVCADLAVGVIGLAVVGFGYVTSTIIAYAVSAVLSLICGLVAFMVCTPFSRG